MEIGARLEDSFGLIIFNFHRSATKGAVVFGWNTHGYREEFYREESHC